MARVIEFTDVVADADPLGGGRPAAEMTANDALGLGEIAGDIADSPAG